jgi:tetratricopeptide (TPR) repeat protein
MKNEGGVSRQPEGKSQFAIAVRRPRIVALCVEFWRAVANCLSPLGTPGYTFFFLPSSFLLLFFFPFIPGCYAQYNIDRMIAIGRSALYYEDYVLSMQYFNQAITAKPYLYEPWFFRGVAKYSLDDFVGAEADCTEAIQRNPYVVSLYELRGLTRIQQKKFPAAIDDYSRALKYDPENRSLWHNRVLCHIRNNEFEVALAELDSMIGRWSRYAPAYMMRADVYMQQKDTAAAIASIDKSLELNPYDGQAWGARSIICLSREEWNEAEENLDKAIHLQPKHAGNYINRALARFNKNNLRGAMADYDTALDLDPNNFLGHYNRGLLRAQVGDDNRAITDFDFVLKLEPDNMMALFNRAVLLDKTGDLRAAIRDYSKVIDEFPNFWTGLEFRAACYRRLGMTRQAENDEFTVYKARLEKHLYGKQPRLSDKQMRKRSDEDPEKYNQIVVADDQEMEHEYQNDYRGRVQNRKVDMELQPMFGLSFESMRSDVRSYVAFDHSVDVMNQRLHARTLYISNRQASLDEPSFQHYFEYLDSLSTAIAKSRETKHATGLLLLRAVAYSAIQNNESAIDDLSAYLQIDSANVVALWQRAFCQSRINQFQASEGTNIELKNANVLADLNHALALAPNNAYLLYNRGCLYAMRQDYARAMEDFTQAVAIEPNMGEAYYNRGLCAIYRKQTEVGISDLSKAGELGMYTAYSIIKKYRK